MQKGTTTDERYRARAESGGQIRHSVKLTAPSLRCRFTPLVVSFIFHWSPISITSLLLIREHLPTYQFWHISCSPSMSSLCPFRPVSRFLLPLFGVRLPPPISQCASVSQDVLSGRPFFAAVAGSHSYRIAVPPPPASTRRCCTPHGRGICWL